MELGHTGIPCSPGVDVHIRVSPLAAEPRLLLASGSTELSRGIQQSLSGDIMAYIYFKPQSLENYGDRATLAWCNIALYSYCK